MVTSTDDRALPIKIDSTSNGEFRPVRLSKTLTQANMLARERIVVHAKHLGVSRRSFLQSLCAAATSLGTLNEAFAAQGNTGGGFRLPKEATYESAAARSALAGDEFIFDVQTHLVDPAGTWRTNAGKYWEQILTHFPHGACGQHDSGRSAFRPINSSSTFSWTVIPISRSSHSCRSSRIAIPLPQRGRTGAGSGRTMEGANRLYLHAMVVPNAPAIDPLRLMEEAVALYPIKAWKSYTQWGPEGVGWELDNPAIGIPFIEKARSLNVRTICIHKGLFFSGFPERVRSLCRCRARREALPRRELYHLPFWLRDRSPRKCV